MDTTHTTDKGVSDTNNVDERTLRALEKYLTVLPDAVDAPGMVKVVSQSEEEYVVDVRGGTVSARTSRTGSTTRRSVSTGG